MTRLIRVELLKIRTMRLNRGLLAAAAGITAVFAVLNATRDKDAALGTASGLNTQVLVGVWALLLSLIFGVITSSSEFRHSTATLTYLATPRRNRVLVAKAIAAAFGGAAFGLAGDVIATGIGLIFVTARGYHPALGATTLTRYAADYVVAAALLAAIGSGLGSLIRSQVAAIIGVFVWAMIIESVLGGLFHAVRAYLPYAAATTLAGARIGYSMFQSGTGASAGTPLPFAAAAALLAGLAILFCVVAAAPRWREMSASRQAGACHRGSGASRADSRHGSGTAPLQPARPLHPIACRVHEGSAGGPCEVHEAAPEKRTDRRRAVLRLARRHRGRRRRGLNGGGDEPCRHQPQLNRRVRCPLTGWRFRAAWPAARCFRQLRVRAAHLHFPNREIGYVADVRRPLRSHADIGTTR